MQLFLSKIPNLIIHEDTVENLFLLEGKDKCYVSGVALGELVNFTLTQYYILLIGSGRVVQCHSVVITTGTFLRGEIHIG